MNGVDTFYYDAKIRGLDSKERNFILIYADKLGLDQQRVLVNKDFFNKIIEYCETNHINLDYRFID